jgi:transposase
MAVRQMAADGRNRLDGDESLLLQSGITNTRLVTNVGFSEGATDMSMVTVFVGLDYHQDSVQVCVMDRAGSVLTNRPCASSWSAIHAVVLPYANRVRAAIEACSGAAELAEDLVGQAGWSVDLAHPGYVARMKQSPDKTDFADARVLADLERVGYLPRVWLAPRVIRELRRLVRFRQQLAAQRRNCKLRIRSLLRDGRVRSPEGKAWTVAWLKWLQTTLEVSEQTRWILDRQLAHLAYLSTEIKAVEKRLSELTTDDPVVEKLLSLTGVGLITAVTLRAEIGHFDRFRNGKQMARFCGLSPRNASSGQRQADAGLIKAGNPELRAVLIELAHRLARYDRRWGKLAVELRIAGKPGSVVAAAIANRWVRWLHHQMQVVQAA